MTEAHNQHRRVATIVQARMSSERLPGKVLADLGPGSTLEVLLRRLARSREQDELAVATSTDTSDDPVAEAVQRLGVRAIRGPLDDVLKRYRQTVEAVGCDGVVRITADCPLIDVGIVDTLIRMWREGQADYVWNTSEPRTFPDGLDVEVFSRAALEAAAAEARDPYDREHVTSFIRTKPQRFPQRALCLDPPARAVKLTLDTPEDLEFLRSFIERVGEEAALAEILDAAGAAPGRLVERSTPEEAAR